MKIEPRMSTANTLKYQRSSSRRKETKEMNIANLYLNEVKLPFRRQGTWHTERKQQHFKTMFVIKDLIPKLWCIDEKTNLRSIGQWTVLTRAQDTNPSIGKFYKSLTLNTAKSIGERLYLRKEKHCQQQKLKLQFKLKLNGTANTIIRKSTVLSTELK